MVQVQRSSPERGRKLKWIKTQLPIQVARDFLWKSGEGHKRQKLENMFHVMSCDAKRGTELQQGSKFSVSLTPSIQSSPSVDALSQKQTIMYGSVRKFIFTSNSQISIPVIYQTHYQMLCVHGKPIYQRVLKGGSLNKTLFKYRIKMAMKEIQ